MSVVDLQDTSPSFPTEVCMTNLCSTLLDRLMEDVEVVKDNITVAYSEYTHVNNIVVSCPLAPFWTRAPEKSRLRWSCLAHVHQLPQVGLHFSFMVVNVISYSKQLPVLNVAIWGAKQSTFSK